MPNVPLQVRPNGKTRPTIHLVYSAEMPIAGQTRHPACPFGDCSAVTLPKVPTQPSSFSHWKTPAPSSTSQSSSWHAWTAWSFESPARRNSQGDREAKNTVLHRVWRKKLVFHPSTVSPKISNSLPTTPKKSLNSDPSGETLSLDGLGQSTGTLWVVRKSQPCLTSTQSLDKQSWWFMIKAGVTTWIWSPCLEFGWSQTCVRHQRPKVSVSSKQGSSMHEGKPVPLTQYTRWSFVNVLQSTPGRLPK